MPDGREGKEYKGKASALATQPWIDAAFISCRVQGFSKYPLYCLYGKNVGQFTSGPPGEVYAKSKQTKLNLNVCVKIDTLSLAFGSVDGVASL